MIARYTCNLCDALCGLRVTVENGRIADVRGDPEDPFSRGHVCPKGPALRELHEDPERLRAPMRRTAAGWQPVGWDEALAEAAERLRAIQARHGRDAVAIYVGNPTAHSHRAGLGSQLLTWALGSRNRFDANSQDANPRLYACWQMYGDPLSMPVPDVDRCDFLLLLGCNPAASNGSMMSLGDVRRRLQAVRRKVLIDPRRNETAAWCDEHHFIRPGADAALLLAMLHVLFADGVDARAVDAQADGREALARIARRFPPERVAARVGIEAETIRRLARELRDTPRAALYARIGASQNPFGPTANWLVEAVNLVSGHFDREGGWMFPEPAADVSALGRRVVGHGRWRSRVRGLPEFLGALPSAAMAEEMETPGDRQIRALVCFAGNPVLSTPNGARLARAIEKLDYFVAIDFQLGETARRAHLVLPPAHLFETSNYNLFFFALAARNLARFDAPLLPSSGRDDWQILFELALRLRGVPAAASLARRFRDLPDRVIDLLLRFGRHKLTLAELRAQPHGIDFGPLKETRRARVHTRDGRVQLAPEPLCADVARLERWLEEPAPPLVLIGRRHLRSNNSWMHTKGPRSTQLLMHPLDARERGLADGARVTVASRAGAVEAELQLSDAIARGVVSLPHGFAHPSANDLTDELSVEPLCGGSILNGVPVSVARSRT